MIPHPSDSKKKAYRWQSPLSPTSSSGIQKRWHFLHAFLSEQCIEELGRRLLLNRDTAMTYCKISHTETNTVDPCDSLISHSYIQLFMQQGPRRSMTFSPLSFESGVLWSTCAGANCLAGNKPTAPLFLAHYPICKKSWTGQNLFLSKRKPGGRRVKWSPRKFWFLVPYQKTEIWDKLESWCAVFGSRLNPWNAWYKNKEEQFLEMPQQVYWPV